MAAYRDAVDDMSLHFKGYEVKYVKQEENWAADALSKLGSSRKPVPPGVFLEHLHVPSIKGADPIHPELVDSPVNTVKTMHPPWTQPFLDYLLDGKLPEEEVARRQMIRRARSYTVIDGQLYKRST